jgi:hypothetical protein
MSTVPIEVQVSTDQLLRAVEQMAPQELEAFVARVLSLRAEKEAPHLSVEESGLLLTVNQPIPPALQQRYDALIVKRRAETLTSEETAELLDLTSQVERAEAKRVEALGKLAQLRGLPLVDLLRILGIQPAPYA